MTSCLLDTGPLVALLDRSERDHARVREFLRRFEGRLITSGAVVTEAFYFLSELPNGPVQLAAFLETSGTGVHDAFSSEALQRASQWMSKYADVPMDFADATLVWIADQTGTDRILTLDRRGFSVFRFANRRRFKLLLDV